MTTRPRLSDSSFLAHIFSPKKNAIPTGLRKSQLSGKNWNKGRLRSYNRMSAVNQEILKRSGTRDAYLNGQGTLADAKRSLRAKAVQLGVAKPVRTRGPKAPTKASGVTQRQVAQYWHNQLNKAGKQPDAQTMSREAGYLKPKAEHLTWNAGQIIAAGRPGSELEVIVNGVRHNPAWYHRA
jgi:hypothetical protein